MSSKKIILQTLTFAFLARKKVLIEDFTGFKCANCPDASSELHKIEEIYPDKVIGIAIHAGSFAEPSGVFVTDFRTDEGNEITDFRSGAFQPGLVCKVPDNVLLNYTDWVVKL